MKFSIKKVLLSCAIVVATVVAGFGSMGVAAEDGGTTSSGQPDGSKTLVVDSSQIETTDAPGSGFKATVIDHVVINKKAENIDFSGAKLVLNVNNYKADPQTRTVIVDISSKLSVGNREYSELKYGGYFQIPEHQVTINVANIFNPGDRVLVTHNTVAGSESSTVTVADDSTITFTNRLGYSTFSVYPAPAAAPAESSSPSVSYDKRDKNQDGVVSCDEAYGEGWTWDESQKACVLSPAASASSLPAAYRNAVPKTGVKG